MEQRMRILKDGTIGWVGVDTRPGQVLAWSRRSGGNYIIIKWPGGQYWASNYIIIKWPGGQYWASRLEPRSYDKSRTTCYQVLDYDKTDRSFGVEALAE